MYTNQIMALDKMLATARIPHNLHRLWDGYQICYPDVEDSAEAICDVVCHSGSYGHENGLLEIMGLVDTDEVGDDVEGFLTAQEVFSRIFLHFSGDKTYKTMKTSKETLSKNTQIEEEDLQELANFIKDFTEFLANNEEENEESEEG